ncbi:hypothetical protein GUJ93_ZPchr0008g12708 [Zizania palustris]|nr:hypothetical protein GUJ93_ZPchr0008g12708 [Zizania palustris]KAG8046920.1 hypothetical protein GUJ93_ZPchr0008g12708 [Zizania palustris]KAG8046921.1 hypothetical protein GUJ93_ZPchr0008g12708 [Zizania palustris]KAG8046922.1 hypothetical protein GUJ93_ZPchr0008g12708 [Zizania palustris]
MLNYQSNPLQPVLPPPQLAPVSQEVNQRLSVHCNRCHDPIDVHQSSMPEVHHSRASMLLQQTCMLQETPPNGCLLGQLPPRGQKKLCMVDRLSGLPDEMLHHIISFLSAQEVARTCLLSKRWKELWTSAPCLDIRIDQFGNDRVRFSSFVENLLLFRAPTSLHAFRLHSFAIDRASYWMDHAIKHNVQVLEFAEYMRWEPFYLDPQLMAFKSRYLKRLKLINVTLESNVFEPLNHECQVLEDLLLLRCYLEVPQICSSSLRNLDIIDCSLLTNIVIRTPSLVSLRFRCLQHKCASCSRSSKATALVTLCDLPNAKIIDLSCSGIEVAFGRENPRHPMFGKLTSLSLGEWCLSNNLSGLVCFLRHSPVLEKLTLKLKVEPQDHNGTDEVCLREARSFSSEHLKKVTICCLEGDARTAMLDNMFCANVASLKEIHIRHY